MRRVLWLALLSALALSGCGLLYDWTALEPSWAGSDAGGRDAAVPSFELDGGFPFASAAPVPSGGRSGRAASRVRMR